MSRSQSLVEIEVRDLAQRMDAGIGAAGALDARRVSPQKACRSPPRRACCTDAAIGLALPADEGRAVIFDE